VFKFGAPYGGLIKSKGQKVKLLKSTFNAKIFIYELSWFIFSHVRGSLKSQKSLEFFILGFKIIQGHRKLVPAACYNTQKSVSTRNRFYASLVNGGEIMISWREPL